MTLLDSDTLRAFRRHPIFILGTQRSGTTLLARILSAHEEVFIQNELAGLDSAFSNAKTPAHLVDHIDALLLSENSISLSSLAHSGITHWGLKDPRLTHHLDTLASFSGISRFVLIVRDGRGVVNSYIRNKWGLGTNAYTGALRWKREVRRQLDFAAQFPSDVLLVRYEDLLQETETVIRNICNHCDIEYQKQMLDYYKSPSPFALNRANRNSIRPPDPSIARSWQTTLTRRQIGIIEEVAHREMTQLGYEPIGPPVRLSKMAVRYYRLHQRVLGQLQLQYRWRLASLYRLRNRILQRDNRNRESLSAIRIDGT